jgi:hypothetical protein
MSGPNWDHSAEPPRARPDCGRAKDAMQIQISYTRKAMQEAVEQAKKFSDLYAKASREIAKPVSGGGHAAAEQTKKVGLKGANETAEEVRLAG